MRSVGLAGSTVPEITDITTNSVDGNGNCRTNTPTDCYTTGTLDVASDLHYYGDRTYVMTDIPDFLKGMNFIRTANDDKRADETDANFLCFTLTARSTVYVLYDSRASSLPAWLASTFADKHAQATLEAHEMRRRRKLRVRELCGWARVGVGWLFNFVLYFICCLFTITTCMLKGRVWTQVWMMSVVSANGLTWGLVEPLECLIVVSLPFLFDNKYVGWLRTKLKDLGFY